MLDYLFNSFIQLLITNSLTCSLWNCFMLFTDGLDYMSLRDSCLSGPLNMSCYCVCVWRFTCVVKFCRSLASKHIWSQELSLSGPASTSSLCVYPQYWQHTPCLSVPAERTTMTGGLVLWIQSLCIRWGVFLTLNLVAAVCKDEDLMCDSFMCLYVCVSTWVVFTYWLNCMCGH